jgi:small subunit ribosomal protein S17
MAQTTEQKPERKLRRTEIGVVTSAHKTPKTIRVEVKYRTRHPRYGKYIRRSTKLHAHDEKGEAQMGDRVEVMECRPISKTKTWRLIRVLAHA